MQNELLILEETSHPNIMRIYELLYDDNFFFIVSEFVKSGELYDFVVQRGRLTETEVRKIIRQVYLSLNYMHKSNIVHRDLKPENILMENLDDLTVKLTDFGFATFFDENDLLDEVLGSPIYMPPEIILRQKYDSKVDTWSAGVVAYILLTGLPPFTGVNKDEVYKAIQH
jgi:calcium-dependent protein kinase